MKMETVSVCRCTGGFKRNTNKKQQESNCPPSLLGELSLDEFIDGARRDKWVMKMLQMDVNPGDWMNEQSRSSDF